MRRAKIIKLKYKTLIIKHLKNKLHFFKKVLFLLVCEDNKIYFKSSAFCRAFFVLFFISFNLYLARMLNYKLND
jgi:hypothetical protein